MFGSLITQPLRIATRGARIGARITLRGAHEAVEIAEGLVALIAARLVGGDSHHNGDSEAEPAAWQGPAASPPSSPADTAAPTATASAPTAEAPAPPAPAPRAPEAPARNGGPPRGAGAAPPGPNPLPP